MSLRRAVVSATTILAVSTLAACGRSVTEPSALAPDRAALQRGADDARPRQEPQPGDDRGGRTTSTTTGTTTDDRGGRGKDDPTNHG